jgi:betaine-aldehyde dehydrogenase
MVLLLIISRLTYLDSFLATDPDTTMGPLISTTQRDKVLHYIQSAKDEGAKLEAGGKAPTDAAVKDGYFIEPTIFSNVHSGMKVFNEEIFGPVCSIVKWTDEDECFKQVNQVPYGLTAAIYTNDISKAVKAARKVQCKHGFD